jgi:hypothetical protein
LPYQQRKASRRNDKMTECELLEFIKETINKNGGTFHVGDTRPLQYIKAVKNDPSLKWERQPDYTLAGLYKNGSWGHSERAKGAWLIVNLK